MPLNLLYKETNLFKAYQTEHLNYIKKKINSSLTLLGNIINILYLSDDSYE